MKNFRFAFLALFLVAVVLVGCDGSDGDTNTDSMNALGGGATRALRMEKADFVGLAPSPQSAGSMALDRSRFGDRRIAETHRMEVEIDAASLHARLNSDMALCGSLRCELISSNYRETGGNLTARVAPEDLTKFLDGIEAGKGKLVSHNVSADDRSAEFVDLTARIKNKEKLRDRLNQMLTTRQNASLQDLLQVEREIARVQEELDSTTGQMHRLDNDTLKASVYVQYQVPVYAREVNYASLKGSFSMAWRGFVDNLGRVVKFVGEALPWLPVLLLGLWLFIRVLKTALFSKEGTCRFWRRKKETLPT